MSETWGVEWLSVTYLGGNCPVQAQGTLRGMPWYFRARHHRASFAMAAEPDDPMKLIPLDLSNAVDVSCGYMAGWYREIEVEDAGWINRKEAQDFILKCIGDHKAGSLEWREAE